MDILDELPKADAKALGILEEFRVAAAEELPLADEAYDRFNEAE